MQRVFVLAVLLQWGTHVEDADDLIRQSGHAGSDGWPVGTFLRTVLEDGEVEMDVYHAVETAAPAILAAQSSNEGGTLKEVPDFRNV